MTTEEPETFAQVIRSEVKEAIVTSFEILMELPAELSKTQAAKRLNISRPTLDKWIEKGKIQVNSGGKTYKTTVFRQLLLKS